MILKALMQKHRKYRVFSKHIVNTVLLSTTAWKNIGIYGVSCFRGWRNDVNSVFFWGLGAKKVESSDISDNLHPLRVYFVFGILSNYLEGSPTQVVETERNHVVLKWKLQNLYVKTWPPVFLKKKLGSGISFPVWLRALTASPDCEACQYIYIYIICLFIFIFILISISIFIYLYICFFHLFISTVICCMNLMPWIMDDIMIWYSSVHGLMCPMILSGISTRSNNKLYIS